MREGYKMKKYILAFAVLATSVCAVAQTTVSGYFVDEYTYRYQMNPAFGNDKNFVSMPVLGNLDFSLNGNMSLTDFIYNVNGQTTTFLNPEVSVEEVMGNLKDQNITGINFKLGILSGGFKAFGGYNTIGINLATNMNLMLPKSIFQLAKEGISNTTYNITDLGTHADAYIELALGHSREVIDNLRVGGTLKFLFGAANLDANLNNAYLTLGEDNWTAVTNATIQSNMKGLTYTHDYNETTGNEYVSGIEFGTPGLSGFGVALDLGAVYTFNDWRFSAALLDLGFISWSHNYVASTNGDKTFELDKYIFNVDDEEANSFENEWEIMKKDLMQLYELEDNGDMGSRTRMLGATMNVGVEYTLPVYRRLTFGLLNSTRFQGKYTWTDFRVSANVAPVDVFSAGINFGAGTYGCSFGWLLNLHTTGFNLFAGMDNTFFKIAKQGVPLTSNVSFNLGINFPF